MDLLPPELIHMISGSLQPEDLHEMSMTDSYLHRTLNANRRYIWLALNVREQHGILDDLRLMTTEELKALFFASRDVLKKIFSFSERLASSNPQPNYYQFGVKTGFVQHILQSLRERPRISVMDICQSFRTQTRDSNNAISRRDLNSLIRAFCHGIEETLLNKEMVDFQANFVDLDEYLRYDSIMINRLPLQDVLSACKMPYLVVTRLQAEHLKTIVHNATYEADLHRDEICVPFQFYEMILQYWLENAKADEFETVDVDIDGHF